MASYTYSQFVPDGTNTRPSECPSSRVEQGLDLPHPKELEVEEIQHLASGFSHDIFNTWHKLNGILKCHESFIQKRWLKKTTKQRERVLLIAEPNIPRPHRPDFEAFRMLVNRRPIRDVPCSAEAHLTPQINLADLATGHNFLLFVNSRGRNPPGMFAPTEMERAHLGLDWKTRLESEGHAMFFHSDTPADYGSVVEMSSLGSQAASSHGYNPIYGLMILEIQQRVYGFLLRCAQGVLHDIDTDDLISVPEEPEPPALPGWVATGDSENIMQINVEADYRKPQEDLSRIKMLVDGRRLAAEDHVMSLREDPGYFLESLKETKEYYTRHEDSCSSKCSADCWRSVAAQMLGRALDSLHRWTWLTEKLNTMRPLQEQIARADGTTLRLEGTDEFEMVVLCKVVECSINMSMWKLRITVPRSSGLRGGFWPPHDPDICQGKKMHRGCDSEWNMKASMTATQARVAENFYSLTGEEPHFRFVHKVRSMVQETHCMLENDKAARDLVDECLLKDFFDLAVLADLQHCFTTFHPYCRSWALAGVPGDPYLTEVADSFCHSSDGLREAVGQACEMLDTLGKPLDGRFNYPADKRRTAETVKQMQSAELALNEFWEELVELMPCYGVSLDSMLEHHLTSDLSKLHITEDWKEEPTKAQAKSQAKTPRSSAEHSGFHDHHFGTMPFSGSKENKKTELTAPAKSKPKTRGKPNNNNNSNEDNTNVPALPFLPAPTPHPIPPSTPIPLPRRTYKVLSALLPTSSTAPREIAWRELLHAFSSLGLIPEKLYGSVWIFKPLPRGHADLKVDVSRSIQFHEPKDVRRGGKIDVKMVRRLGGRLKRAFGWGGEGFVDGGA